MKKNINIVLIVVVLGLWGTVGYKAINNYFFFKKAEVKPASFNAGISNRQINKDTFRIETLARDPFLNKQGQEMVSVTKKYEAKPSGVGNKQVIQFIKPMEYINWPSISYYGYIKSKENNEELILVKINDKLYKIRINDQIEGITLKKVYKDSIEFNFNKEKKTIQKKAAI